MRPNADGHVSVVWLQHGLAYLLGTPLCLCGGPQACKIPATQMTAVRQWIQFIKLKLKGAAVFNTSNYIIIALFICWCDQAAGLRLVRSRRIGQQQHN